MFRQSLSYNGFQSAQGHWYDLKRMKLEVTRPVKSHSLRVRLTHFGVASLRNPSTIYMKSHSFFTSNQHT